MCTYLECKHPGFFNKLCVACDRNRDDDNTPTSSYNPTVPLHYGYKDLRLSKDEIARLKVEDTKIVLGQKKLYLVLDLDQTLLHSVRVRYLDQDKFTDFLDRAENSLQGELFHVEAIRTMTKLRPFVRTFLQEANTMFKMYIYTTGKRRYAKAMASLLDPDGLYFGSRIIAREDITLPCQKELDVVLGLESALVILDDNEKVWPARKENLILVEGYYYFSHEKVGGESDGVLVSVLEVLKKIHTKFFAECDQRKLLKRDVRQILEGVQRNVNKTRFIPWWKSCFCS